MKTELIIFAVIFVIYFITDPHVWPTTPFQWAADILGGLFIGYLLIKLSIEIMRNENK